MNRHETPRRHPRCRIGSVVRVRYRNRGTLLSRGELAFFCHVRRAVRQRWLIMCKVRLADAVTCSAAAWRAGAGNAIAQKHLDFIICDPCSTKLLLAIELDDRTHVRPDRRRRDRFLNQTLSQAGIRLLRFRARSSYCPHEIRKRIESALTAHLLLPN